MREPRGSLIYLMRFLEGHLSASETAAARRRLESPEWQSAWQRLQLAAVDTDLPFTPVESNSLPAETMAAFLEGTLEPKESARVERDCWNAPQLLREFVSTYRFLHCEPASAGPLADQPSAAVTQRLQALFPDRDSEPPTATGENGQGTATMTSPVAAAPDSADRLRPAAGPTPADLPVVTPVKRVRRGRRRRTRKWVVYAATVLIGLGLGISAMMILSRIRAGGDGLPDEVATPVDGDRFQPPPVVPRPSPPPPGPAGDLPASDAMESGSPEPRLPVEPFDLVDDDTPSRPAPRPDRRPAPRRPVRRPPTVATDSPPESTDGTLVMDWEKIEGLLVARHEARQPWHGPLADTHRGAAASYATLPGSWAMAKTNHGRIVLAADTEVHVDGRSDAIEVDVTRGQFAVSELPPDQQVDLRVGASSWIIQPMEADTAIGCTVFARQSPLAGQSSSSGRAGTARESQLIVRRGRVFVAGVEVAAGRQVVLADGGLGQSTPIESNTGWFTRPEAGSKVPAAMRQELLISRDVRADLNRIWRTDDHPARLIAAQWSLAIDTDQTLGQALAARDAKVRLLALNWLVSCHPNDPRVLLALRALARQTGDPQMVRNVLSWLRSARTGTRLTRADADRMVAGLRSDHLAIRQTAAFFLQKAFGPLVTFDPASGPLARQRASREWTAVLNRLERANRLGSP